MFKKSFKTSSQTQLGGKDRKKLKKDLCALFNKESVDHFIESNEKIVCEKIQGLIWSPPLSRLVNPFVY